MQDHRIAWPADVAAPGTPAYQHQRELLLELVVDAPAAGEPVAVLARRLGRSRTTVAQAAAALARSGLVATGPSGLRATPAALAFEALWPTRL